jgi:FkbM family methyltransferase
MITTDGITLHLDLPAVHEGEGEFAIRGWVTAHQPILGVALAGNTSEPMTLGERPDVARAFPSHPYVIGFSGRGRRADLSHTKLCLAVRTPTDVIEVRHPVPTPRLASAITRVLATLACASLQWRKRFSRDRETRWLCTLRQHRWRRRRRGGFFIRSHTEALMADFARDFPRAHFIQIGANDGLTFDPLREILLLPGVHWSGLLVEPVAHLYAQLRERCLPFPDLQTERAAIGETDGSARIFRVETKPGDPIWLEHLASFDREILRRTAAALPDVEERIVGETVPCLRVETLLRNHAIEHTDLLVIDTEGWDWRVLRQFDLGRLRPWLILVEHQHLTDEEKRATYEALARGGYEWAETPEGDTIAWRLK